MTTETERVRSLVSVVDELRQRIAVLSHELEQKRSGSEAFGIKLCIEKIEGIMTFATLGQRCEARRWARIMEHVSTMENRIKNGANTAEIEIGIEILIGLCGTP